MSKQTMKDLATLARRAHDPAFSAILDYVDAVREQVTASAMRDGAAAALTLLAQEIRKESGCFTVLDGSGFERFLRKRVLFYEDLADPANYTTGEFADHVARHKGAAKAIEFFRAAFEKDGFFVDFDPTRVARGFEKAAAEYRTGEKRLT